MLLLSSALFTFPKKCTQEHYQCQIVWIQKSVLIWFQTVWKGYQQTTKASASKERVLFVCFMSRSTIFQSCQDGSSWVEPVLATLQTSNSSIPSNALPTEPLNSTQGKQGTKIFQYCTCPAGRMTYNFHLSI